MGLRSWRRSSVCCRQVNVADQLTQSLQKRWHVLDILRSCYSRSLSSQLAPSQTRRWLKPLSHTSALTVSVGAPWEIWRTKSNITTGNTIDLYTKSGGIGLYESHLILIPDYQVAVSIISAGPDSGVVNIVAETVLQQVIPALAVVIRDEVAGNMAGIYVSEAVHNSSIVLNLDDGPGLVVESWISEGSDLLKTAQAYASATKGGEITSVRLYPTDLVEKHCSGSRVGYRAVFESAVAEMTVPRVIKPSLTTWAKVDQAMYGNVGADDFVFEFDAQGTAVTVESRVLRVILKKQSITGCSLIPRSVAAGLALNNNLDLFP